jgi:hypothetical protein
MADRLFPSTHNHLWNQCGSTFSLGSLFGMRSLIRIALAQSLTDFRRARVPISGIGIDFHYFLVVQCTVPRLPRSASIEVRVLSSRCSFSLQGSLMRLSINTATSFLFSYPPTPLTTSLLNNVHHSSERKVIIPQVQNNVRNAVLSLRSLRASPCGTDIQISAQAAQAPATSRSAPAHLPVRTRPSSTRDATPPPCPFALSSPRSCTTPQCLPVRALAPPSTLVCVVRQPIFQARRSRMPNYGWVFVHNPGSIGARE